jgi:S-adenosylmethionine:tRNA ribosyltransferase-isomerase
VRTDELDYGLPPERIAQTPAEPRDAARLLVDRGPGQPPDHTTVRELPRLLRAGDLLVVNDTRVLPARLRLRKATGGAVEVLLLQQDADPSGGGWEALVRPARRVPAGTRLEGDRLWVEVCDSLPDGRRRVRLHHDADDDLAALAGVGEVPLPPYITAPLADPERYQTVYARSPRSVAAPTAGLHLTAELLARLEAAGVELARVELAVGLGTFRPIAADDVAGHVMHAERYAVPAATSAALAAARARGGRVVAVGTTVVRALESMAATGDAEGSTELFIRRPHRFAHVDLLLTNFHTPRSSLLAMVDAFVGARWRALYDEALATGYRFLSFGDAMLLQPSPPADDA